LNNAKEMNGLLVCSKNLYGQYYQLQAQISPGGRFSVLIVFITIVIIVDFLAASILRVTVGFLGALCRWRWSLRVRIRVAI